MPVSSALAPAVLGLMLSYFVGDPTLCTAGSKYDLGTYDRQALDETTCPGQTLVLHTTGSGAHTWGLEVFNVAGGWIRITHNLQSWAGQATGGRLFYRGGQLVGTEWLPETISDGQRWEMGLYHERWYKADTVCEPDPNPPGDIPGKPFPALGVVHTWPSFLLDDRPRKKQMPGPGGGGGAVTDPGPFGPYDIEAVTFQSRQGPIEEWYTYGRWTDPTDGVQKGLGLVALRVWTDTTCGSGNSCQDLVQAIYWRHLVPCKPMVPCFVCPVSDNPRRMPEPNVTGEPVKREAR